MCKKSLCMSIYFSLLLGFNGSIIFESLVKKYQLTWKWPDQKTFQDHTLTLEIWFKSHLQIFSKKNKQKTFCINVKLLQATHKPPFTNFYGTDFILIGMQSIQCWAVTMSHGVPRKIIKRLKGYRKTV